MNREIISEGVWRGWQAEQARRAYEWQMRCYLYDRGGDRRHGRQGRHPIEDERLLREGWSAFERNGTLPELAGVEASARAAITSEASPLEYEWPWVLKLRAIPMPWPQPVAKYIELDKSTETIVPVTDAEGRLLHGCWRGFTHDEAAAWSHAFFQAGYDIGVLDFKRLGWFETKKRFYQTGGLPPMWRWAKDVARLESEGHTPESWLAKVREARSRSEERAEVRPAESAPKVDGEASASGRGGSFGGKRNDDDLWGRVPTEQRLEWMRVADRNWPYFPGSIVGNSIRNALAEGRLVRHESLIAVARNAFEAGFTPEEYALLRKLLRGRVPEQSVVTREHRPGSKLDFYTINAHEWVDWLELVRSGEDPIDAILTSLSAKKAPEPLAGDAGAIV